MACPTGAAWYARRWWAADRACPPAARAGSRRGAPRVGHIPHLLRLVAERPQEVGFVLVGSRQFRTGAHPHHLRPAVFRFSGLAGNVREVLGLLRVGHIEDRCAVVLLLAGERVQQVVAVMPDVGDPAAALLVDHGLIGAAALEVVVADQLHVALLGLVLRLGVACERDAQSCEPNDGLHANLLHAPLPLWFLLVNPLISFSPTEPSWVCAPRRLCEPASSARSRSPRLRVRSPSGCAQPGCASSRAASRGS